MASVTQRKLKFLCSHKGVFTFIAILAPFYCVKTNTIYWSKFCRWQNLSSKVKASKTLHRKSNFDMQCHTGWLGQTTIVCYACLRWRIWKAWSLVLWKKLLYKIIFIWFYIHCPAPFTYCGYLKPSHFFVIMCIYHVCQVSAS